jgi:hypothetical protein
MATGSKMADSKNLKPIPIAVMLRARAEFSEVAQRKGDAQYVDRVELSDLFTILGLPKVCSFYYIFHYVGASAVNPWCCACVLFNGMR